MLIPVVLSGGAGTRLWPVSREAHPKPFIQLPDGQSLLQKTFLRAAALDRVAEVLTVTNRDYYFKTKDEYTACQSEARTAFLLEPCGRNTAPAVALAALYVQQAHGPEATLLVMPADHLIADLQAFSDAVAAAQELAAQGYLATFGIQPTSPETGFGYIEAGSESILKTSLGKRARRFVEKPDAAKAAEYVAAGNFYWNSGMFCFQAGTFIAAMEAVCPEVLEAARVCWAATRENNAGSVAMFELEQASFAAQSDISIDYAVMEKAENVAVVPCNLGWSDIGSWNALADLIPPDSDGNRTLGDAVLVGSKNTFVQSEHHLVAAVGVEDLMIIDTQDAVLVAHKDKSQDVRKVVQRLKQHGHEAYRLHRTVSRPWGTYTVLEEGKRFKMKRIEVKPGASLSLQMHHHRSEHWIVVSGMAKVVIGDHELFVDTNQSTYIPAGHKHRLENPGILDLVMIEVQSGEYLGEDDIVRFEDNYGRC
ncbi:MAG: mannose-1-phosphate guanylyltransferase/mannose-6-phosphate isomerase [Gammaproteobacteria bacterium]|nr:mannose-1-phosphate guanylyltransferase/mannose-6-phosphate isomerase [Gammaproteobacteria bacterium]MBU1415551.1 mannose-1-phosphate guanylyltransferase/mannose-6-phosphate isomerase [Gammaproteobacteria bacterium]